LEHHKLVNSNEVKHYKLVNSNEVKHYKLVNYNEVLKKKQEVYAKFLNFLPKFGRWLDYHPA